MEKRSGAWSTGYSIPLAPLHNYQEVLHWCLDVAGAPLGVPHLGCMAGWARTGSQFSPLRLAGDPGRAVSSLGLNVHSAASFASASATMASLFWRARSLRVSSARGSGCARALAILVAVSNG